MTTPRTEAGKRLLDQVSALYPDRAVVEFSVEFLREQLLAIEAEAAIPREAEGLREALRRLAREAEARNESGQSAVDWSWFSDTARAALAASQDGGKPDER